MVPARPDPPGGAAAQQMSRPTDGGELHGRVRRAGQVVGDEAHRRRVHSTAPPQIANCCPVMERPSARSRNAVSPATPTGSTLRPRAGGCGGVAARLGSKSIWSRSRGGFDQPHQGPGHRRLPQPDSPTTARVPRRSMVTLTSLTARYTPPTVRYSPPGLDVQGSPLAVSPTRIREQARLLSSAAPAPRMTSA
jgi:hypothetical protein